MCRSMTFVYHLLCTLVLAIHPKYVSSVFLTNQFSIQQNSDQCTLTLVESLPEGLEFPKDSPRLLSIYDAHARLISRAQRSVHLGTFYWTLLGQDLPYHDNSSYQGEDIFKGLKNLAEGGKVDVKIAQNNTNHDTSTLESAGAQVRTLDFERLLHGGVLHTKLWLVDSQHFFVGSANFDWRSYTQIKELGVLVENCPLLGQDVSKMFEVYWYLGQKGSSVPPQWPLDLATSINASSPAVVKFNQTSAQVYLASSPPPLCPSGRTTDLEAILSVIQRAREFVYISVMDYFPALIYGKEPRFWPAIDDELRHAIIDRSVSVHLMAGQWVHTEASMYAYLASLAQLDRLHRGEVKVNLFTVPSTEQQKKIPYARVNHCKFMVTDQHAYIGTSNWSEDYFTVTAGVSFVVHQPKGWSQGPGNFRQQLEDVFVRDFTSNYSRPVF